MKTMCIANEQGEPFLSFATALVLSFTDADRDMVVFRHAGKSEE